MRIAMVGSGYVGLVSGACFSEFGIEVVCVDKDARKIAQLRAGEIPIFEPGLHELMQENYASGQLQFTNNVKLAVKDLALAEQIPGLCVGCGLLRLL